MLFKKTQKNSKENKEEVCQDYLCAQLSINMPGSSGKKITK